MNGSDVDAILQVTELLPQAWVSMCMSAYPHTHSLLHALQQFQQGRPEALWARLQAAHLSLEDVTSIQQYLALSRHLRAQPCRQTWLPQLHYRLFVAFNLRVAQADVARGGRYRPFKLRMYVLKYVAKQCFAGHRAAAKRCIAHGIRTQGWPPLPATWPPQV